MTSRTSTRDTLGPFAQGHDHLLLNSVRQAAEYTRGVIACAPPGAVAPDEFMRKLLSVVILTGSAFVVADVVQAQDDRPHWAYGIPPEPSPPRPPDDGTLYTLPGTDRTFTSSQIRGPSPAASSPTEKCSPADLPGHAARDRISWCSSFGQGQL